MFFIKKYRIIIFPILVLAVIIASWLFVTNTSLYSFHKLCPFSSGCTLYKFKDNGISYPIGFIVGIFLITLSIFFRRIFCSTACPIGLISDLLAYPVRKIEKLKKFEEKATFHKFSLLSRIIILLLSIIIPFFSTTFFFQKICPMILSADIIYLIEASTAFGILLAYIILSMFVSRFFCRFVCSVGLIMGAAGKIGNKLFPTLTVGKTCKSKFKCLACKDNCPMGIDLAKVEQEIDHIDCIVCMDCVTACVIVKKKLKSK